MSYELKLEKAEKELKGNGLSKTTTPFLTSWLVKLLGIKLPPPYYCSFIQNFIHSALSVSFIWFLFLYFKNSISPDDVYFSTSYYSPFISSLIFGGVFGIFMAIYYKRQSLKKHLSEWSSL